MGRILAYKMRRHIQKQLSNRSQAIKSAVKSYNQLAATMDPPRDPLDSHEVLDYAFLAEFDLLRFSQEDIRDKEWVKPANRQAMQQYFQIKAAHNEIIRLNVEGRRLVSSIHAEHIEMPQAISRVRTTDPALAHEIEEQWQLRQAINRRHLNCLKDMSGLHGFSGSLLPGCRKGSVASAIPLPDWLEMELFGDQVVLEEEDFSEILNRARQEKVDSDGEGGEASEDDEIIETAALLESWQLSLEV